MDPAQLTGEQLADHILRFCTQNRKHLDRPAWDVVRETCRRLKQHEVMIREVLPDLRNRLVAAEGGAPEMRRRVNVAGDVEGGSGVAVVARRLWSRGGVTLAGGARS